MAANERHGVWNHHLYPIHDDDADATGSAAVFVPVTNGTIERVALTRDIATQTGAETITLFINGVTTGQSFAVAAGVVGLTTFHEFNTVPLHVIAGDYCELRTSGSSSGAWQYKGTVAFRAEGPANLLIGTPQAFTTLSTAAIVLGYHPMIHDQQRLFALSVAVREALTGGPNIVRFREKGGTNIGDPLSVPSGAAAKTAHLQVQQPFALDFGLADGAVEVHSDGGGSAGGAGFVFSASMVPRTMYLLAAVALRPHDSIAIPGYMTPAVRCRPRRCHLVLREAQAGGAALITFKKGATTFGTLTIPSPQAIGTVLSVDFTDPPVIDPEAATAENIEISSDLGGTAGQAVAYFELEA